MLSGSLQIGKVARKKPPPEGRRQGDTLQIIVFGQTNDLC
jgi:hypothetical protein